MASNKKQITTSGLVVKQQGTYEVNCPDVQNLFYH